MSEMTYAVHTGTCTYLLDDEGICLWTVAAGPSAAPGTDRCVGAQFVACLDVRAPGALVGELRVGGCALFVRREHGRFVLLRTMPIERVEERGAIDADARAHREQITAQDATAVLAAQQLAAHEAAMAAPRRAPPPPPPMQIVADQTHPLAPEHWARPSSAAAAARDFALANAAAPRPLGVLPPVRPPPPPIEMAYELPEGAEALDAEDLVSISVTEVTLTMPLYRRPAPPPPPSVDDAPPTPRGPPPQRRYGR
jgi:hypothetical protein